jgi:hypothetical protein
MIKTQTWRPDTCGCAIEQRWNTDAPHEEPAFVRMIEKCPAHQTLSDARCWAAVGHPDTGENRRKNYAMGHLLNDDVIGETVIQDLPSEGIVEFSRHGADAPAAAVQEKRIPRKGVSVVWTFEGAHPRTLKLRLRGVPAAHVTRLHHEVRQAVHPDIVVE